MTPTEFRIGNYCRDKITGEWLLVDELVRGEGDNHLIGFYVVNREKYPLPNGWQGEPIPLTPEILEKAGFRNNHLLLGEKGACSLGWHLYSYKGCVNLAYDYDDCAYASHNAEHETELKYVHQLQNLYFALTGAELEINL